MQEGLARPGPGRGCTQPAPPNCSTHRPRASRLQGELVEKHSQLAAGRHAAVGRRLAEELPGVEAGAQPFDVGPVLRQGGYARLDRLAHVHVVGRRLLATGYVGGPHLPGLACLWEDPPVGRVPAGVQQGQPDRPVVRVVGPPTLDPGELEVEAEHDLGAQPPQAGGNGPTEPDAVLDQPVGEPRYSTWRTPTTAAERRCSSSRTGPACPGAMPSIPASPRVAST